MSAVCSGVKLKLPVSPGYSLGCMTVMGSDLIDASKYAPSVKMLNSSNSMTKDPVSVTASSLKTKKHPRHPFSSEKKLEVTKSSPRRVVRSKCLIKSRDKSLTLTHRECTADSSTGPGSMPPVSGTNCSTVGLM